MATGYQELDVVNYVLAEIGRTPITNISDSPSAQVIANKIPVLLKNLLIETIWNFTLRQRTDSTPITNNPYSDYTYAYQLPVDYGRMQNVTTGLIGFPPYEIRDNYIVSNNLPITYIYIVNNATYNDFTDYFFLTLCYKVAGDVCLVLTQNQKLQQDIMMKYKDKLAVAIALNAYEKPIVNMPYNEYNRTTFV